MFSQRFGGESLYGASAGIVYRFETAGGIAGLNAFYDRNWILESERNRQHAQGSIGADFQTGRSRLGANWYFPLSETAVWNDGLRRLAEYAVGGAELRYRFALDDNWAVKGRAFFELDPSRGLRGTAGAPDAAEKAATVLSAGASYRIDCTKVGLDLEYDSASRNTAFTVNFSIRLGGSGVRSCAETAGPSLAAPVERSKIVRVKRSVVGFVPFTRLPADVTALFQTVAGGSADADEVWLYSQGGPVETLGDGLDLQEFPGYANKILVNVHQAQTFNTGLYSDTRLNSFERVQAEMDVSVEILHRTIRHFKAQGKKVVVFGHSFGALVLTRYLALRGPAAADRYVIMAGRLDMERTLVDNRLGYLNGKPNGIYTFEYDSNKAKSVKHEPDKQPEDRASEMGLVFQGILARHRYTQLLKNADLRKVLFAYGDRDRRTGSLDTAEVNLLTARGARAIAVSTGVADYIGRDGTTKQCTTDPDRFPGCPGRHGSMFEGTVPQDIVNWIDRP